MKEKKKVDEDPLKTNQDNNTKSLNIPKEQSEVNTRTILSLKQSNL